MFVARSFSYGSPSKSRSRDNSTDKSSASAISAKSSSVPTSRTEWKRFGWRPDSFETNSALVAGAKSAACPSPRQSTITRHFKVDCNPTTSHLPLEHSCSSSTSANSNHRASHSAPMAVPQRQPSKQYARTHSRPHPRRQQSDAQHNAESMPSSVAALLAVTKIPKRTTFPRPKKASSIPTIMSMDDLAEHWKQMDEEGAHASVSSNTTLELLLSPPAVGRFDMMVGSERSGGLYSRSRTTSSDSMPSLEFEVGSFSSCEAPSAPEVDSYRTSPSDRKLASPAEEIADDHPLSANNSDTEDEDVPLTPSPTSPALSPRPRRKFRFKSNLTASINALRSAARSFSNFAAASVPPENYISSGLLGPPFPSEMRPNLVAGTPTPQLRRYLNPVQHNRLSPQELHFHDAHVDHTDLMAAVSITRQVFNGAIPPTAHIIPMQTYTSLSHAGAEDPALRSFKTPARTQRHREPRENPEFLRICVLEMAMRRAGKLESLSSTSAGTSRGRKAFWLPPRMTDRDEEGEEERVALEDEIMGRRVTMTAEGYVAVQSKRVEEGGVGRVPRRWRQTSVVD